MRFLFQMIFIALLAWGLQMITPWWSIAVAAALGGLLFNSKANFVAGFIAIGVLWLITAWMIDNTSPAHLADKVAAIMGTHKTILLLITCLIGALVGGFAAMTGGALRKSKKRSSYYR